MPVTELTGRPGSLPVVPPGAPVVTKRSRIQGLGRVGRGRPQLDSRHAACRLIAARRADLDWLRVLAFGLLILYHAGMAWSGWSWHVTSPDSLDVAARGACAS